MAATPWVRLAVGARVHGQTRRTFNRHVDRAARANPGVRIRRRASEAPHAPWLVNLEALELATREEDSHAEVLSLIEIMQREILSLREEVRDLKRFRASAHAFLSRDRTR